MVPPDHLGREVERLRQCRVGMDGQADVPGVRAHLDGERRLRDEVAGVRPDDAGSEQSPGLRIEQYLGQAFAPAHAEHPPARGPRERRLVDLDTPFPGLGLGEPRPRDLRVGVRHRGDCQRVEARLVPGAHLRRHLALVGRLVGEHRRSDDVPDREDVPDVGALLAVDGDEAVLVDVHAGVLGPDPVAVRPPSDRDEDPVERLRCRRARGPARGFERDAQPGIARRDVRDPGGEPDRLVDPADTLLERLDEIAVAAGHESVHQLHHVHPRPQRRIDGRHLQPDDAAPDDEEARRHLVEHERVGRIHQPGIVVRKSGDLDRLRAGRDDRVLEFDLGRAAGGRDAQPMG